MARLDFHARPGPPGSGYLLDVQSNLLSHLNTRAVMLLMPCRLAPPPIRDLNPVFDIDPEPHVLLPQTIATVATSELRRRAGALDDPDGAVTRAIDILLIGI